MNNLTTLQAFVQNPNHYAQQTEDGYFLVREEITEELLRKHLAGEVSVGTYFLFLDKARAFAFDIDDNDRGMAAHLGAVLRSKGLLSIQEVSGRKGYHVWCLLQEWEPASQIVRLARAVAAEAGFDGEVYPKQAVAKDTGNLMKLPMGVHAVSGKRSRLLNPTALAVTGNAHERFAATVSRLPEEAKPLRYKTRGAYRCVESIWNDPPSEGERNNTLYHKAVMAFRGGSSSDEVSTMLHLLNERCDSPFPGDMIDGIVERADVKGGPRCYELRADRRCGDECLQERDKHAPRPGYLRGGAVGERIIVQIEERKGNNIWLYHPDAFDGIKAVLKRENP